MDKVAKSVDFTTDCGFRVMMFVFDGGKFRMKMWFQDQPVDMHTSPLYMSAAGAKRIQYEIGKLYGD